MRRAPALLRYALGCAVLAALAGGCQVGSDDVAVGPGGELLAGRERASDVQERGVALAGRPLVLDGFAGTVAITGTDEAGDRATLRFERVARGSDAEDAQERLEGVTVEESGDAEGFVYTMRAARTGGAEVNVEARVPRGTTLVVRLAAGAVRLSGTGGAVEVTLEAGTIRAAGLAGRRVLLRTQSGTIDAGAAAVPAGADWRFETRVGGITLTLPPGAPARVEAETTTGTVRVDGLRFANQDLEREGAGARFSGRLGEGEGRVDVRTEVGTITLRGGRVERLDDEAGGRSTPPARPAPRPGPGAAPRATPSAPVPSAPATATPAAPAPAQGR